MKHPQRGAQPRADIAPPNDKPRLWAFRVGVHVALVHERDWYPAREIARRMLAGVTDDDDATIAPTDDYPTHHSDPPMAVRTHPSGRANGAYCIVQCCHPAKVWCSHCYNRGEYLVLCT